MNMVKLLLLLCLISGMSFFSEQSLADQNDPRLATLFLKLGNAETPQESKPFERQIWQVWMEHESPEISTKLQEGSRAMQAQDFVKALVLFPRGGCGLDASVRIGVRVGLRFSVFHRYSRDAHCHH